jgi:hypothetical protein
MVQGSMTLPTLLALATVCTLGLDNAIYYIVLYVAVSKMKKVVAACLSVRLMMAPNICLEDLESQDCSTANQISYSYECFRA